MKKNLCRLIVISVLTMLSVSCASLWGSNDDDTNPFVGVSEKDLYKDAKQQMKKEQYTAASKRYEAIETMYPFSDRAEQAKMNLVYAYYKAGNYVSAAAESERFIQLYPRSEHVDYIYYLKGLSNFNQVRGAFANVLPMDESWRDPGTQQEAYSDFALMIERFPNSKYRANAIARMTYLRNMFAKRELNAANYYYGKKMYVAAKERAAYLVKNYPQAPQAKPALQIIYRSSIALGLTKEAENAANVYQATFHKKIDMPGKEKKSKLAFLKFIKK